MPLGLSENAVMLLQSLTPPLTDEESRELEKSILAEGCRDALVL